MKKIINKILIHLLLITLLSCATKTLEYTPNSVNPSDARKDVKRLAWEQHETWRPLSVEFTDEYVFFNYGTVVTRTTYNYFLTKSSRSSRSERLYYDSIEEVKLYDWTRKFKTWYLVSATMKNGKIIHLFRSRDRSKSEKFVDSLTSVIESM